MNRRSFLKQIMEAAVFSCVAHRSKTLLSSEARAFPEIDRNKIEP